MVTHETEDEKYVDRVIWLKDGLVEKISVTRAIAVTNLKGAW